MKLQKSYIFYLINLIILIILFVIGKTDKVINTEFLLFNMVFTLMIFGIIYTVFQFSEKFRNIIKSLLFGKENEKEKKTEIEELEEIVINYYLQKRELETAKELAETQAKTKEIFLQNMSHEIRTPLNGIVAISELFKYTELSEKQKRYVDTIIKVSNTLVGIINNILEYSKIQTYKTSINKSEFNVREMVMELKTFFISGIKNEIFVIFLVSEDIPESLIGDSFRIKQVLINILGNAFKFTQSGVIKLEVICKKKDGNRGVFEFSVSDTGIGIPENKMEDLFKSFMQADESISRRYGGTGLGLAIAKEIVEAMGGKIAVSSQLEKGSSFSVEIPMEIGKERIKEEFNQENIVIFEENKEICNIILKLLSQYSMNTYVCHSCDELRDVVEENGKNILIIVRSEILEKQSEVYKYISEKEIKNKIILIKDGEHEEEKLIEICITEYPIAQEEFIKKIKYKLGYNCETECKNEKKEGMVQLKKQIALIEDNEINAEVMSEMLEKIGAEVTLFQNGIEAVKGVKQKDYDLIISDIQLPDLSGFEILKLIREYDIINGNNRKIIALTAHAVEGYREKCLRAGFDDYMAKPVTIEQLYKLVAMNTGEESKINEEQVKNMKTLNKQIIEKFRDELKKNAIFSFKIIKKYIDDNEQESALFEIHKLKGSFGNAKEIEIYKTLTLFEESLKNKSGNSESRYEECLKLFKERFKI